MNFNVIYEDRDVLVINKPAGIIVFQEAPAKPNFVDKTLIDLLIEKYPKLADVGRPPRCGVVHRLDKYTSGLLLVAKNTEALIFFQKQFSIHTFFSIKDIRGRKNLGKTSSQKIGKNSPDLEKKLEKRYIALVTGTIKENNGIIETLIGRSPSDPKKQKVYPLEETKDKQREIKSKREAITEYEVLERFEKYTLLEVKPKTGRKHQIRCHFNYIHHPIAGDKMYGFKDSPIPEGLTRQFLHASYLKIKLPSSEYKEFKSELPEELQKIINKLT